MMRPARHQTACRPDTSLHTPPSQDEGAPFLYISSWRELPALLEAESALPLAYKVDRRCVKRVATLCLGRAEGTRCCLPPRRAQSPVHPSDL